MNFVLDPKGDLHRKLVDAIKRRWRLSHNKMSKYYSKWDKAEEQTEAYVHASEADRERKAARDKGEPRYTTIRIPYTYAQTLAIHTYWSSVFLSRDPILQFQGRHGETEQAVKALEALIGYQTAVGGHVPAYYIWLYDAVKYGMGVICSYWDTQTAIVTEMVEEEQLFLGMLPTGKKKKVRRQREIESYAGHKHFNVRPYDFFPDPRVTVGNLQKGEFVGRYAEVGWNYLRERSATDYYMNVESVKKTRSKTWMRDRGTSRVSDRPEGEQDLNFGVYAGETGGKNQSDPLDTVGLFEFFWELVPSDWGLGNSNRPEKWVFVLANDEVIVLARPLGLIHNHFPCYALEYEIEGYNTVKRPLSEIVAPLSDTIDWLFNSHMYNVRSTLNNQLIVDPSKVYVQDFLSGEPGLLARLKPEAYGTDVRSAVHQLSIQDVTQNNMRDLTGVAEMLQRVTGANDAIMGAVNPTATRRTATETRSSTTFGINRLKTSAEYFSATGFASLAQDMVQTTQQEYDGEKMVRIAGALVNPQAERFISVSPEMIAGFYDFVPVDGTLPVDRFAMASLWKDLMLQMKAFPEIMMQYDVAKIFGYVAHLAGLRNLDQFRIQPQSEESLEQQVTAGNLVPLRGSDGQQFPGAVERATEPRQVAGMGGTL